MLRSRFDSTIDSLLNMFTLDQILEMGDLTDYDVLRILFEEGHLEVPEYLIHTRAYDDEKEEET